EDPAAVLVRDPALAAVPDRLEHGHADVARLALDRVDDRLDALPDDHRLDLDHGCPPSSTHKKAPGLLPPRRPRLPAPPSSTARTTTVALGPDGYERVVTGRYRICDRS